MRLHQKPHFYLYIIVLINYTVDFWIIFGKFVRKEKSVSIKTCEQNCISFNYFFSSPAFSPRITAEVNPA